MPGLGRPSFILLLLLLAPALAGAAFSFGVTPTEIDEGVHERGSRFYTTLRVFTGSDSEVTFDLEFEDASLSEFGDERPDSVEMYSEERCGDCVSILRGGGEIQERDSSLDSDGRSIDRWREVSFMVEVPEDMEPGYHMLRVNPVPSTSGGAGGVSIVSSVSIPVVFRVPGEVVRSGKILGVSAGPNIDGNQRITSTFYNNGTVTMEVGGRFVVDTLNGTESFRASSKRVAPGERVTFSTSVDTELVNRTFDVRAVSNYGTGSVSLPSEVTAREPVRRGLIPEREPGGMNYTTAILLLLFVTITTAATWKTVERMRR